MFGYASVALFVIAFLLNGTSTSPSSQWFSSSSLMLAGLACLALHLLGHGASWRPSRPRGWLRR